MDGMFGNLVVYPSLQGSWMYQLPHIQSRRHVHSENRAGIEEILIQPTRSITIFPQATDDHVSSGNLARSTWTFVPETFYRSNARFLPGPEVGRRDRSTSPAPDLTAPRAPIAKRITSRRLQTDC